MWNGTMFVDLDWPLNASSLLSASAELLVTDWQKRRHRSWARKSRTSECFFTVRLSFKDTNVNCTRIGNLLYSMRVFCVNGCCDMTTICYSFSYLVLSAGCFQFWYSNYFRKFHCRRLSRELERARVRHRCIVWSSETLQHRQASCK